MTPVNVDLLKLLLRRYNYGAAETQFLVDGFRYGFNIGYIGSHHRRDRSRNHPIENKVVLWNKIMKEVKCKRYAGPFESIPFKYYVQSPVRLVPKSNGDVRLIFDLSHNFGDNPSVNGSTDKTQCLVKYRDLDYAVNICNSLKGEMLYFGSTDFSSAFRMLPVNPKWWFLMFLKAEDPKTGRTCFFVDKCLAFRHSISCALYQKFSNCVRFLLEARIGKALRMVNYLDDFLYIETSEDRCNKMVRCFMRMCEDLSIPLLHEKTVWGTKEIVFLGIIMNGEHRYLRVPKDKRLRALNALYMLKDKKKVMVNQLQTLTGFLNFLTRAIFPGRAFTRRMYSKFSKENTNGKELKPYHHVSLDKEFKLDCMMWIEFLTSESQSLYYRPFADLKGVLESEIIHFYTDASKNSKLGFGCVYGTHWAASTWEKDFIERCNPSIEYLELYA